VEAFFQAVSSEAPHVEVIYVVLWVNHVELLRRDGLRLEEYQMGDRCLQLADEFERTGIDQRFFYHTNDLQPSHIDDIVLSIRQNRRFRY
jgi:hypothetical protein